MASNIPSINPLKFSLTHKSTHYFVPRRAHTWKDLNNKTRVLIPSLSLTNYHNFHPSKKGISLTSTNNSETPIFTNNFQFYPHSHPSKKGISVTSPTSGENQTQLQSQQQQPVKTVLWVLFWASVSIAIYAFSKDPKSSAIAASNVGDNSIKGSNFGFKIANKLRGLGWFDEIVVLLLATLPVIELRGAIPVGYWMQLNPILLTLLSILGNMIPVPFIILYLKKFANFVAGKNRTLSKFLDMLFERAKNMAAPVEEFQWLGLMLFVAVPFPGTGAWTGAIIASVLDMPFWPAVSANFFGVVLAGLLVNLLVNLGLKYAIITGVILFFVSTFMWSILRIFSKSLTSPN